MGTWTLWEKELGSLTAGPSCLEILARFYAASPELSWATAKNPSGSKVLKDRAFRVSIVIHQSVGGALTVPVPTSGRRHRNKVFELFLQSYRHDRPALNHALSFSYLVYNPDISCGLQSENNLFKPEERSGSSPGSQRSVHGA